MKTNFARRWNPIGLWNRRSRRCEFYALESEWRKDFRPRYGQL